MVRSKETSIKQNKNFVEFLKVNPYASAKKNSLPPSSNKIQESERVIGRNSIEDPSRPYEHFLENDFLAPREGRQTPKHKELSLPAESTPKKKIANIDEMMTESSVVNDEKSINQASPKREGGRSKLDPSQKKMLEAMQKMIVSLEQEARKLKKSNADYESKAKKLSEQVTSFNTEKENFARVFSSNFVMLSLIFATILTSR